MWENIRKQGNLARGIRLYIPEFIFYHHCALLKYAMSENGEEDEEDNIMTLFLHYVHDAEHLLDLLIMLVMPTCFHDL